jgi:hypothetical protein
MHAVGQILRIAGIIICALAVLFYTGNLLILMLALVAGTAEVTGSLMAGRLLGTLLADLVFLAIGMRLWKGLRRART